MLTYAIDRVSCAHETMTFLKGILSKDRPHVPVVHDRVFVAHDSPGAWASMLPSSVHQRGFSAVVHVVREPTDSFGMLVLQILTLEPLAIPILGLNDLALGFSEFGQRIVDV